jgi:hypothetical protein
MIMTKYIGTDNAKLLETILINKLSDTGLSVKDAAKIAREDRVSKEDLFRAISWCQNVVKEYVGTTGALCKGELKFMGSIILDVPAWKFNQYIMEKTTKYADNLDLKDILLKDGVQYEKLFAFIQQLETPRIIKYKDVVQHNHIVWYTDFDKALQYVNNFLTEPYLEGQLPKKEFKKQIHKKNIYLPNETVKEHINTKVETNTTVTSVEELDKLITPIDFAVKYYLDDKSFKGGQSAMSNSKENVDRALLLGGLADHDDRRSMVRKIISNYKLARILMISGSNDYSKEKVKKIGELRAESSTREELMIDINNVFGR